MSISDLVQNLTFNKMQSKWMRSFAVNMPAILRGKDVKDLPKHPNEVALVIGAGPSVKKFRQLDVLAKSRWKGVVICADKILKSLLKRSIIPNIVCSVDGDVKVANFYAGSLVKKNVENVKAVLSATTVHPKVVENCPLEKHFFVPKWDDPSKLTSLTRMFWLMTKKTIMETGGNAGSCGWYLARFLGAKVIGLLGLDYAYYTKNLAETTFFETFKILSGGTPAKPLQYYRRVKTWAGYEVLTDIYWLTYLQLFLPALNKADVTTYNLSPLSIVISDKVRGMQLEEFLKKFK